MGDDFKLEWQEDDDETGSGGAEKSPSSGGGKHRPGLPVLLGAAAFCLLAAGGGVWWYFSRPEETVQQPALPVVAKVADEGRISSARALEIMENRKRMRGEFRSSHNAPMIEDPGEAGMVDVAIRGELTLVTGLFQHYVQTTAAFFELSRIITNNYVENRGQVEQLFLSQIKPAFDMAERRREILRRRISRDPAQDLYKKIDWIAYHDSLAVMSMQKFVEGGETEDFVTAVDYANKAKLMLRKLWITLRTDLRSYKIGYNPPEDIWRRYYVAWDIVE